jgi:hypothetical protein
MWNDPIFEKYNTRWRPKFKLYKVRKYIKENISFLQNGLGYQKIKIRTGKRMVIAI